MIVMWLRPGVRLAHRSGESCNCRRIRGTQPGILQVAGYPVAGLSLVSTGPMAHTRESSTCVFPTPDPCTHDPCSQLPNAHSAPTNPTAWPLPEPRCPSRRKGPPPMSMHDPTNSDTPDRNAPASGPTHARMRTTLHSVSAMQTIALPQAHDRQDRPGRTVDNSTRSRSSQSRRCSARIAVLPNASKSPLCLNQAFFSALVFRGWKLPTASGRP